MRVTPTVASTSKRLSQEHLADLPLAHADGLQHGQLLLPGDDVGDEGVHHAQDAKEHDEDGQAADGPKKGAHILSIRRLPLGKGLHGQLTPGCHQGLQGGLYGGFLAVGGVHQQAGVEGVIGHPALDHRLRQEKPALQQLVVPVVLVIENTQHGHRPLRRAGAVEVVEGQLVPHLEAPAVDVLHVVVVGHQGP